MRIREILLALACLALLAGCQPTEGRHAPTDVEPPMAKVDPTELEKHGDVRVDDYYWLKQRENSDVISYLEAENEYMEKMTAHTERLQETLFKEFKERIKQTDESVPYKKDDYYYYARVEESLDYPFYCRKKGSLDAEEEIMLDVNKLAEGHGFYQVAGREVSTNQLLLAFAADTQGRRIHTIRFKNLETGEMLPDEIPNVTGNVTWANDDQTVFYTKQDPTTLRWFQIYRHTLGTDPSEDVLVYQEDDETFNCGVGKSKSKRYVAISCQQTLSNEYYFLDADDPTGKFKLFQQRERDHEYDIDHYDDYFYIRTNNNAKNFRLMRTPVGETGTENWEEVIPHRDDVLLQGIEIFKDYLVVSERENGLRQLRIMPWSGEGEHYLDFGEPAYLAFARDNYDFDTMVLRYHYESMTTPDSVYDYDMKTREKTLLKQDEVLGGFDRDDYVTERLSATARDGVAVPVSIVYRKGNKKNGKNPLLLGGYGSYGSSRDATFSAFRISLLDRGFVYAIAHIRGGSEMGRLWYEDGKLLKKKNTFTDFIDAAEFLVAEKFTQPDRLFCQGGSAGGLLIGAVLNMRPDLFKAAHAAVPFVDVVTTMLDDSIPLTTGEYDEWGNPNDPEYYEYIKSYSSYDNVAAVEYPDLLVTTSLHDSQVQYFEPAKWVAKLRATANGDNVILLKTEMEAGHGGASARDKRYEQTAFTYAFFLDMAGMRR